MLQRIILDAWIWRCCMHPLTPDHSVSYKSAMLDWSPVCAETFCFYVKCLWRSDTQLSCRLGVKYFDIHVICCTALHFTLFTLIGKIVYAFICSSSHTAEYSLQSVFRDPSLDRYLVDQHFSKLPSKLFNLKIAGNKPYASRSILGLLSTRTILAIYNRTRKRRECYTDCWWSR